jgi:hypothetical protein
MSTFSTCTSTTRPSSPTDGDVLFETDTKTVIVWDGSAWYGYDYDDTTAFTNRYKLTFDGSGDYANTGYYPPSTTAISYSFWTNSSNTTSSMAWLASTNSGGGATAARFHVMTPSSTKAFYATVSNGSSTYANVSIGGTNSTLAIRDGNWHHVVFSINGTAIKIWIDGGSGGSPTYTDTSTVSYVGNAPTPIVFGRLGDYGSYYLNGSLDEVAIFEYELSATQVANIYNSGTPVHVGSFGLNLSPAGYWRGGDNDNGTGSTITDLGSGGNDATLSGNAVIAGIGTGESIYV